MRNLLYIISFLFIVDCFFLIRRKSFTIGLVFMFLIAVILLASALFYPSLKSFCAEGIGHTIKICVLSCLSLYFIFCAFFLSFGKTNVNYNESAVIVLGCGLNLDGTPSKTLQARLDGAIEYEKKNPNAYIVVTGAKSHKCDITEALGMKNYLVQNGISENKIIMEEHAVNTRENFRFSKQLLEEYNIPTDDIVYITNSFHAYRAGSYAAEEGFTNFTKICVKTDLVVLIPAVLRESCGVAAMLVFGY